MKRMFALLMALVLAMSCMAWAGAEETEGAAWALALQVLDVENAPIEGAQVTITDPAGEVVLTAQTDGEGRINATLPQNTYNIHALNPAVNYSTRTMIDLFGDMELELVIRTLVPGSEVTVGSLTKVSGQFATDLFGNNTSDMDVRAMLHGYSTIAYTNTASYAVDESVATVDVAATDGLGNKMYVFRIQDGLTYNDGTPITARDYVFSILMQSAPQVAELGGQTKGYWQILGYDEYNSGERNYISGLRLLDDMSFSINLRSDSLPYFYELTYVNVTPYPIQIIAPACDVADDGRGAYISGAFTTELLQETLLDPESGYCSHPTITSGPYQLESYDAATGTVVMKANTRYKGNYEGQKPLIETVTLKETTNGDALAQLADGTLDIVNKISDSQVIQAGTAQAVANDLQMSTYLRSGLGFLSFACEEGPTSQVEVRQAISRCLDQEALVSSFIGTAGRAVYSWYGLGQWMVAGYLNDMEERVTTYPLDLNRAIRLLQSAGYGYNEQGKQFNPETDTVRYRLLRGNTLNAYNEAETHIVDAIQVGNMNLLPLKLVFARVENNRLCDLLIEQLVPNLEAVGFQVDVVDISFEEMMAQYYRDEPRKCNMFALATNFTHVFDPLYTWNGEEEYQGHVNTTGIRGDSLVQQARRLRNTTPGDDDRYLTRWLQLMQNYSTLLPAIPLYSNMYYDFCGSHVQDYSANAHWSWSSAILYTWLEEPAVEADAQATVNP